MLNIYAAYEVYSLFVNRIGMIVDKKKTRQM
jgi:hypothetical protein